MTEKVKPKIEKVKKLEKKKNPLGDLTDEEREAVTIVFHQFETGLREGTIFTKVGDLGNFLNSIFIFSRKSGSTIINVHPLVSLFVCLSITKTPQPFRIIFSTSPSVSSFILQPQFGNFKLFSLLMLYHLLLLYFYSYQYFLWYDRLIDKHTKVGACLEMK